MSKKISMPKLLTVAALTKEIDAIGHAVGGIGKRLHEAAIQCLAHAMPEEQGGFGDARMADKLIQALTIGVDGRKRRKSVVHVEGLVLWFTTFSPIRWNGDGKVKMLGKESKDYGWDVAKAIKTPYWDLQGQASMQPFTIETMLKVLMGMPQRLVKAQENDRFEGDAKAAEKVATMAEATAKKLAKDLGIDITTLNQRGPASKEEGNIKTPAKMKEAA